MWWGNSNIMKVKYFMHCNWNLEVLSQLNYYRVLKLCLCLKILRTTPCLSTAAQNLIGVQNIVVRLEALCIKSFYTPFHFIWNYNPRLWRSAVHWKKHSTNNVFIGYILVKGKVIIWVCFENQNPCFFQGLILNRKN